MHLHVKEELGHALVHVAWRSKSSRAARPLRDWAGAGVAAARVAVRRVIVRVRYFIFGWVCGKEGCSRIG